MDNIKEQIREVGKSHVGISWEDWKEYGLNESIKEEYNLEDLKRCYETGQLLGSKNTKLN